MHSDLPNGTVNEALAATDPIGPHTDINDSGIPSGHSAMNGMPTASMPIPFQRMSANDQQQQLLLYQQQQQQAYVELTRPGKASFRVFLASKPNNIKCFNSKLLTTTWTRALRTFNHSNTR